MVEDHAQGAYERNGVSAQKNDHSLNVRAGHQGLVFVQKYLATAASEMILSSTLKPALSRSPSIIQVNVECSLRMWSMTSSAMSGPA